MSLPLKSHIKHILAVILANSALQLCGTPWLSRGWGTDSIRFMQTAEDDVILRPVIPTHFDSKPTDSPLPEDQQPLHKNPDILALGILLLELFFGKPIEEYRTADDLTPEGKVDANTDFWVAGRLCDESDWDVHLNYRRAVEACLNWNLEGPDNDFNGSSLYQFLYKDVVWLLEKELKGYELSVTQLDELLLNQSKDHAILQKLESDLFSMSSTAQLNSTKSRSCNCNTNPSPVKEFNTEISVNAKILADVTCSTGAMEEKKMKPQKRRNRGCSSTSPHDNAGQQTQHGMRHKESSITTAGLAAHRPRNSRVGNETKNSKFALFDDRIAHAGA
jgi:hypothetical protein